MHLTVSRDNPGREVVVRFERNGEAFELPVVPELSPSDNFGQIGVKLAPNSLIRHRRAPAYAPVKHCARNVSQTK